MAQEAPDLPPDLRRFRGNVHDHALSALNTLHLLQDALARNPNLSSEEALKWLTSASKELKLLNIAVDDMAEGYVQTDDPDKQQIRRRVPLVAVPIAIPEVKCDFIPEVLRTLRTPEMIAKDGRVVNEYKREVAEEEHYEGWPAEPREQYIVLLNRIRQHNTFIKEIVAKDYTCDEDVPRLALPPPCDATSLLVKAMTKGEGLKNSTRVSKDRSLYGKRPRVDNEGVPPSKRMRLAS